jgi:hypothetical protein
MQTYGLDLDLVQRSRRSVNTAMVAIARTTGVGVDVERA